MRTMSKLKTFFYSFWHSCTDVSYYQELLTTKFSFSLKYLGFLFFLISLVNGIIFATSVASFLPQVPLFITKVKSTVRSLYPAELVVTVKNGAISINQPEPYTIDFPKEFISDKEKEDMKLSHLITIDTHATLDDYKKFQSAVLVTRNAFIYPDRNGVRVQYLDEKTPETTIDRQLFDDIIAKIEPYFDYLPKILTGIVIAAVVLFPFVGAWTSLIGSLFYLLIMTLVSLLLAKILKKQLPYRTLYRLSLHALTAPIVLTFILGLANIHIPFLYSILYLLWMGIILSKLPQSPVVPPQAKT